MAPPTKRGLERFILFSDAIVAIAITVLVLPLTELRPAPDQNAWEFIVEHVEELVAFALSFIVIARFWVAHNWLFSSLAKVDTPLMLINAVWLASVVLLPFPTNLLDVDGGYASLYLANLLLCAILTGVLSYYLDSRPALIDQPSTATTARSHRLNSMSLILPMALAFVASLFIDHAALWLLLLLPIAGRIASRLAPEPKRPEE